MNSKGCYLLVGFLGALFLVGLASAASVQPSPLSQPDPSGGHFVRRLPDYDSGWLAIDPGETLALIHNLGGSDTDDYVVDLMFSNDDGAHHLSYGGDQMDGDEKGAYWSKLTTFDVKVTRWEDDLEASELRLRIWIVPDVDYDSGWTALDPEEAITLTHGLGGDPDDYLVYLEAKDTSLVSPGFGVNHLSYGMDADRPNGSPYWYGFYWRGLTSSEITVCRAWHDWSAEQVRVRVWVVPDANYDSGWVDLAKGGSTVLEHDVGDASNPLYLHLEFKDNDYGSAINQWCYGRVTIPGGAGPYHYGATWHNLSADSVTVSRGSGDLYADQVRVRIWIPYRLWLPLGLDEH
jgi:hypothetical protein